MAVELQPNATMSLRQPHPSLRVALIVAGIAVALIAWTFSGYVFWLNHRISQEMLDEQWKRPTEIYSSARGNAPFVRVYGVDWRTTTPVDIAKVPPQVSNAFIAAEDIRFRRHIGVDPIGIARALFTNLRGGGIAQGGSTIDQQIIKTKFLSQERTLRRKVVEALLAVILDARLSKDEILEAYLNDVYLGHYNGRPILGLDEAARIFFDKSPARLSAAEAALVAGIIRAPNRDTPDKRPEQARARRDAILRVMHEHEQLSDDEFRRALDEPVRFRPGSLPYSPYQFSLSVVRREVLREVGEAALRRGGLRVYCEIDPRMQQQAERSARRGVATLAARHGWIAEQTRKQPLQVAILSVDPRSGGIRAVVGGSDPRISSFDRTIQMRRQPGSAFKTFAYLTAIQRRSVTPATLLQDTPLEIELAGGKKWAPHNYDEQFRGRVTLRESFEKSLNVPTVRMNERVGPEKVVNTVERFGFPEEFDAVHALPLGVTEVTVRELTGAYTAFPNLGKMRKPFLLTSVKDRNGKTLYEHKPETKDVVDAPSAYVMHTLLRGVVQRGTAKRLQKYGLDFVAGKTGTTSDYRDAWFVGYTRDLVTTVWVGFDDGAPLRLSSGEAAIPIWGSYMQNVSLDDAPIERPERGVVMREIDPESGMLWREGCPGPIREYFLSGTAPTHSCPTGLAGRVLRRVLFDNDNFDEPAAITFDQFRRWTYDVDQQRQAVENRLDRIRRFFTFGGREERRQPRKRDD